jgi:adenosylcobinamide kinase/adenosylcobinamide-phosphate guanylyltransferase
VDKVILVTGGARSGKSRHAEALADALAAASGGGQPAGRTYIATAEPGDAEMRARIAEHAARRGAGWTTLEEPLDLTGALTRSDGTGPRLVDCLTLWLSNQMFAGHDLARETKALVLTLGRQRSPVILVTNELGMGLVPETALGRAFRDAQGRLNQAVAAAASKVVFVVCGLPLRLK